MSTVCRLRLQDLDTTEARVFDVRPMDQRSDTSLFQASSS